MASLQESQEGDLRRDTSAICWRLGVYTEGH